MFKQKWFLLIFLTLVVSCSAENKFSPENLRVGMSPAEVKELCGKPNFEFSHKNSGHMIYGEYVLYFKQGHFQFAELRN